MVTSFWRSYQTSDARRLCTWGGPGVDPSILGKDVNIGKVLVRKGGLEPPRPYRKLVFWVPLPRGGLRQEGNLKRSDRGARARAVVCGRKARAPSLAAWAQAAELAAKAERAVSHQRETTLQGVRSGRFGAQGPVGGGSGSGITGAGVDWRPPSRSAACCTTT